MDPNQNRGRIPLSDNRYAREHLLCLRVVKKGLRDVVQRQRFVVLQRIVVRWYEERMRFHGARLMRSQETP